MFEIGWAEIVVIGVVALIVIGPEDLPEMFRQLGRFTAKLRAMGREFQRAMDQAAKDTGVKDVAKDIGNITSPKAMGLDAVKAAADKFEKWDPIKNAAKPTAVVKTATAAGEAAADAAEASLTARTATATASMTPPVMPAAASSTLTPVSDLKPAMGPATQALYDKQAARQKVLEESAAKLKAIDAGEVPASSADAAEAPAPKKPRAPRKASAVPAPAPAPEAVEAPAKPARKPRAKPAAEPLEQAVKAPRKTTKAKGGEA